MRIPVVALLFIAAFPAFAAPRVGHAGPSWVTFDHGDRCEAVARSIRLAAKDRPQARASFAFDSPGRRWGEFAVRLSRPARVGTSVMLTVGDRPFLLRGRGDWAWSTGPAQEASIIAAARSSGGMRVESRDVYGRRIVDRYLLDGVATAIDAAAAACARPRGVSSRPTA